MLSLRHVWIIVTDVANSLFGSPFLTQGSQYPIGAKFGLSRPDIEAIKPGIPIFRPPGSNIDDFWCDYSKTMPDFEPCATPEDQSCWLRNPKTGQEFNLTTDYEDIKQTPKGVTRVYYLNVTDGDVNANGLPFGDAKLFNGTFPGPLIEACWGDTVIIHVRNYLKYNGTSIHWHGLRQWQTMHMDGVNGLTQCPIATGSEFMYNWTAMQYGTSCVFEPQATSMDVLLGGIGNITRFTGGKTTATDDVPPGFEILFDDFDPNPATGAKRYLLRLINTAFDNSFIFTIDNHNLTVVEADFVPIHNFNTTSILVAIGQRYNIVVEATPIVNSSSPSANPIPEDKNFWIRTYLPADSRIFGNYNIDPDNYMKTGVLRYDKSSTADPTSTGWNISDVESDKSINDQLKPFLPWKVTGPANWNDSAEVFDIVRPNNAGQYALAFIAFQRNGTKDVTPFQTTYGNPTFLNLDNVGDEWPAGWFVVPENYTDTDWSLISQTLGRTQFIFMGTTSRSYNKTTKSLSTSIISIVVDLM
ncbi:Laccase [Colletotrichum sp. SAR11_57]|nr:Laccase [Colletotrichum sp. SAR11_57]